MNDSAEAKIVEAVARAFAARDGLPESAFLAHDESLRCQYRVRAFSAWGAAKAALAEAGWCIAPREPTEEMIAAGKATQNDCIVWSLEPGEGIDDFEPEHAYAAMIAAAPDQR